MNEAVYKKNRVTLNGGGKRQVKNFKRQEFWKCIGCILSAVTYGKKGRKIWSEVPKGFGKYDPKGGTIVWTCVKDHVIDEKEDYKEIGLCGFDCSLFEEKEGGGKRDGLDGYPYLKHLIQL